MSKRIISFVTLALFASVGTMALAANSAKKETASVLSFKMKSLAGEDVDLAKYQGKVIVVVNVASQCGYTPQYEGLQALYDKHAKDGLVVLGFPCNQFGKQEPGSDAEIAKFCDTRFSVKFDMFSKVDVNGAEQCPLYKYLTSEETNSKFAGPIKWNFEKFVIDRSGKVVARFASKVKPESKELTSVVETALKTK